MNKYIYGMTPEEACVSAMTPSEYEAYALDRVRCMSKGLQYAKDWFQKRSTPLNRLVLDMAEHQLEAAERKYGISRNDQRLSSLMR